MARKRMTNPRKRPDYGKRLRVDDPSQGTPFTRGFYTPNNITSNEYLFGKQTVEEVRDIFEVTTLFNHQDGWLEFWDNLHEIAYKKVMREFYRNLSIEEHNNKMCIVSTVKGVDFTFNEDDIARWFGLRAEGECWFHYDNWPICDLNNQVEIQNAISNYMWNGFELDVNRTFPDVKNYPIRTRLALILMNENISPRNIKDGRISCMSAMLLYYLDTQKHVKFNLPRYIIYSMHAISGRSGKSRSPGFGMMITRICREKGINLENADGKIDNFPMWTLGWTYLIKLGLFWFNGHLITKAQFEELSPKTQKEIRKRAKDGTTISKGNIPGEENIDLDDIGDSEEDAELRDEGDTDNEENATDEDEDEDTRRAREESRTKAYTDVIRRQEMARGAGSSGTHYDDIPPPPPPQPDQTLLLGQILSQLQEMNITAEARWQQQLEWQRAQEARWEEWYQWRNNQFPPPPPPQ